MKWRQKAFTFLIRLACVLDLLFNEVMVRSWVFLILKKSCLLRLAALEQIELDFCFVTANVFVISEKETVKLNLAPNLNSVEI